MSSLKGAGAASVPTPSVSGSGRRPGHGLLCGQLLLGLGCMLTYLPALGAEGGAAALATSGFEERFRSIIADSEVPGAAYAIVADGRIVEQRGIGVRGAQDQRRVTPNTVFRVASVSKTFAAQLAANLIRDGRLRWDQSVLDFAPDLGFKSGGHAASIHLEHLLSHTAGAVPNAFDNLVEAGHPIEKILPAFASLEPTCAVGRCYAYQNTLFSLVEAAVERESERRYEEEVRVALFEPLGMSDASFGLNSYLAAENRALPHVPSAAGWIASVPSSRYYQLPSAAGVNASANDLARWLLGQLGSHPDIINAEDVVKLTTPRVRTPRIARRAGWYGALTDAHYGLGWRIYAVGDDKIYGHTGLLRGFSAEIAYSREHNVGIAVLMNGASSPTLSRISAAFWMPILSSGNGSSAQKQGKLRQSP